MTVVHIQVTMTVVHQAVVIVETKFYAPQYEQQPSLQKKKGY
jgi:hypothetical protein